MKKDRSQSYYRRRYAMRCPTCNLWTRLMSDGSCYLCLQTAGVKTCKRCGTHGFADVTFAPHRAECRGCINEKRRKK